LGLLVGTDFNDGAKGYGPKKALKLVRQHLGWSETLKTAGLSAEETEPAAAIFRSPEVAPVPTLSFGPVDAAAVERILVEGRGFSPDRVRAAIARTRHAPPPAAATDGRRQSQLDGFGGA
ncbi:MAG TPA: hypothetical protein VGS23_08720, partial [Thermoplasmata archaeon]|nr:hypothetical protein [Thermoplasmata archaeon]